MKSSQLDAIILSAIENIEWEYDYYGLRFENLDRQVGDICGNSRHNPEREDERDFPEYGGQDYDDLPELGGVSAWYISKYNDTWKYSYWGKDYRSMKIDTEVPCRHCYIVAGNHTADHDDCDAHEIVIGNAVVVAKIY